MPPFHEKERESEREQVQLITEVVEGKLKCHESEISIDIS